MSSISCEIPSELLEIQNLYKASLTGALKRETTIKPHTKVLDHNSRRERKIYIASSISMETKHNYKVGVFSHIL